MFVREYLRVMEYYYPFADKVNPLLFQQVKELGDSSTRPSNAHTSKFTGWNLNTKEVNNLVRWVGDLITRDFGREIISRDIFFKCVEVWGALYNEGDYITPHHHLPSLYSFVYYINAPKGSSPFTLEGEDIPVRAGKVLYFKGDAIHEVKPSGVDGRCMLTGNIVYVPKQTLDKSSETVV